MNARRSDLSFTRRLGLAVLILPGLVGTAFAQQPSQSQINAIRQSCRADYQAHCSSVPTGGQAALACLQENAASLSPSCQTAVGALGGGAPPRSTATSQPAPGAEATRPIPRRREVAILRQACSADYRTLCRGVRPGGGAAIACLRDNSQSLSPRCQNALMSVRQAR